MKMPAALLVLSLLAPVARADEGMWTFDKFPAARCEQKYGFTPTQPWLDHVRLSSARLAQRLLGELRLRARPRHDEPPLRARLHRAALDAAEGLREERVLREGDGRRGEVPRAGGEPARPHHRRHPAHARASPPGSGARPTTRRSAARSRSIEKECQTSDRAALRGGDAVPGRPVRPLQVPAASRTSGSSSRPSSPSPSSAATRTTSCSRATTSTSRSCACTRTASRRRWRSSSAGRPRARRRASSPSSPGTPAAPRASSRSRSSSTPATCSSPTRCCGSQSCAASSPSIRGAAPEQARHSNADLFYVENSYKALRGRLEALQDRQFFASKVAAEQKLKADLAKDPHAGAELPARLRRHRPGAGGPEADPPPPQLHGARPRLLGRPLRVRARARPRRRRAGEAERAAPARVPRVGAAGA